jgi:hypothetical protein
MVRHTVTRGRAGAWMLLEAKRSVSCEHSIETPARHKRNRKVIASSGEACTD